jgi:hypothetical protein
VYFNATGSSVARTPVTQTATETTSGSNNNNNNNNTAPRAASLAGKLDAAPVSRMWRRRLLAYRSVVAWLDRWRRLGGVRASQTHLEALAKYSPVAIVAQSDACATTVAEDDVCDCARHSPIMAEFRATTALHATLVARFERDRNGVLRDFFRRATSTGRQSPPPLSPPLLPPSVVARS